MTIDDLILRLYEKGYSKEAREDILQGYDLGYAQALIDTNKKPLDTL